MVYGENGSGKTGYARLLGCAGFSRGEHELLPDVLGATGTQAAEPAAEFSVEIDGRPAVQAFAYGAGNPALEHLYVFDNASAEQYLTTKTAFSFSPAGLDCLDQLAAVVDQVGAALQRHVEEWRRPLSLNTAFAPHGEVARQLAAVTARTKLESIRKLATLSQAEQARRGRLDREIAELKLARPSAEIERLEQAVGDLRSLRTAVGNVEQALSDAALANIARLAEVRQTYRDRAAAAEAASASALGLAPAGASAWRQMVEAARTLTAGDHAAAPTPGDGDLCPLCRQPLSAEARTLLARLWQAVGDDNQQLLQLARRDADTERRWLAAIPLDFLAEHTVHYRRLQDTEPSLLEALQATLAVAERRRQSALALLAEDGRPSPAEPPAWPAAVLPQLDALAEKADLQIQTLRMADPGAAIAEKEGERQDLLERQALDSHIAEIGAYIHRLSQADGASRLRPRTTNITMKRKELFTALVTAGYVRAFQQTLAELKHPLQVKIVTSDAKGKSYKQIALDTAQSGHRGVTPEHVLSEGEQRIVALADFLTEVSLDEQSAGIVLDDPVLSLDANWSDAVAQRLVQEASTRQVIVFTHSLPFVQSLQRHGERERVDLQTHRIYRDAATGRPGYVALNERLVPA